MAMSKGGYNFKVVLLGEGSVGKTSLILRYVEDKFSDKHISTMQASFLKKKTTIDGNTVNLSIWDTAGQERFHALGPIYYRDSHGAILVYDITDKESYMKVQNWVKELQKMLGEDICLAIVGNKMDLEKNRQVTNEEVIQYTQKVGAMHINTSAKNNDNVEELFENITKMMIDVANVQEEQKRDESAFNNESLRVVDDEDLQQPRRSSCC